MRHFNGEGFILFIARSRNSILRSVRFVRPSQVHPYDALVVASGAELDYAAVPGLSPATGHTFSTFTAGEAVAARDALAKALAAD